MIKIYGLTERDDVFEPQNAPLMPAKTQSLEQNLGAATLVNTN